MSGSGSRRSLRAHWDGKRSELTESGEYRVADLDIFANGIPSLAPEKEHSTNFDQTLTRLPAELPKRYEVVDRKAWLVQAKVAKTIGTSATAVSG